MSGLIPIILSVVGVGALLYSLIALAFFVGGRDDYSSLQPMLTSIAVVNLIGTVLMMIGIFMYFKANPVYSNLYSIAISGIAIFFSITAVSVSVLGKVYS